jgi:putative FmdB family regulatory protein
MGILAYDVEVIIMPMYEYGCMECQNRFDRLRRMDQNDQDVACPYCQSAHVERRLSVFAAHSKGGATVSEAAPAPQATGGGCCGGSCGCGSRN